MSVCVAPKRVDPALAVVSRAKLSDYLRAGKKYGFNEDDVIDGEAYRFRYAEHPADAGIAAPHPGVDYLECGAVCLARGVLDEARADLGSSSDYGIPGAFCAAAVMQWIARAAKRTGLASPIAGSTGAKHTMIQFRDAKLWIDAAELVKDPSRVRPGMIAVWTRGDPKAQTGHIGIVETYASGGVFGTIEANATATVSRFATRRLDAPTFLGMGRLPCASDDDGPSVAAVLAVSVAAGAAAWGLAKALEWAGVFR